MKLNTGTVGSKLVKKKKIDFLKLLSIRDRECKWLHEINVNLGMVLYCLIVFELMS